MSSKNKIILVTGSSGFIGFHLSKSLLEKGYTIVGVDNENDYYDVNLKEDRRKILEKYSDFKFYKISLEDNLSLEKIFDTKNIDIVINLAAQAWVRYSLIHPEAYVQTNIVGFFNILELVRKHNIKKIIYASSSSVYGKEEPTSVPHEDNTNEPISLYAATKMSNELMAHVYSHAYGISTIGLRFFTVYGPFWRPDMAIAKFNKNISSGKPIDVYNFGNMQRSFTYIDDIVEGIIKSINYECVFEIFNLGNDNLVPLESMIEILENYLNKKAIKNYLPLQIGDAPGNKTNIDHSLKNLKRSPGVDIETGLRKYIEWYREYYFDK